MKKSLTYISCPQELANNPSAQAFLGPEDAEVWLLH